MLLSIGMPIIRKIKKRSRNEAEKEIRHLRELLNSEIVKSIHRIINDRIENYGADIVFI